MTKRPLSTNQNNRKRALFEGWKVGYFYGHRGNPEVQKSADDRYGGLSPIAYLFFAKFIEVWHPDLVEKHDMQMTELMNNLVPEALSDSIESKLSVSARETGVPREVLRAIVHGVATADLSKEGQMDAAALFRDAALAVLQEAEKEFSSTSQ
jgi:hypothetical protein